MISTLGIGEGRGYIKALIILLVGWSIKPILTNFQVLTRKYKVLAFYAQPPGSHQAVLENSGFVFPGADLKIS